ATRFAGLPDVPAVGELVLGYETSGWAGLSVPTGTAVEIVDQLNREVNAGLAEPFIKTRLGEGGAVTFPNSPAEFAAFIADETRKFAKVIKFASIKPV